MDSSDEQSFTDDDDDWKPHRNRRRKPNVLFPKPKLVSGLRRMGKSNDSSLSSSSSSKDSDSDSCSGDYSPSRTTTSDDSDSDSDSDDRVTRRNSDTPSRSNSYTDPETDENDENDSNSKDMENNTNKKQRKANACVYCSKLRAKMSQHLRLEHKWEPEIKRIDELPPKERLQQFSKLIGLGNYKHNSNALRSGRIDDIILKYTPRNLDINVANCAACVNCGHTYSTKTMSKHKCVSTVEENENVTGGKSTLAARSKQRWQNLEKMKPCVEPVINSLNNDDITGIILCDKTIIKFAEIKMEGLTLMPGDSAAEAKYNESVSGIRAKLRLVARFLKHFRIVTKKPRLTLTDALASAHQHHLPQVIAEMSQKFETPHAMVKLKALLEMFFQMLISESNSAIWRNTREKFMFKWKNAIQPRVTKAKRNLNEKNQFSVPPPEMMAKFIRYIIDNLNAMVKKEINDENDYLKLARFALARITIYNKRRGNEVARMTIDQYKRATTSQGEDHSSKMSSFEKELGKISRTVVLKGKSAKNEIVYASILPNCVQAIEKILEARERLNINKESEYVFATTGKTNTHLQGPRTIRSIAKKAKVEPLDDFKAGKLRKYIATAMDDADESQKQLLSQMLGHTKSIHDNVYVENMRSNITKNYKIPAMLSRYEASIFLGKDISHLTEKEINKFVQKTYVEERPTSKDSSKVTNRENSKNVVEEKKSNKQSKKTDKHESKGKKRLLSDDSEDDFEINKRRKPRSSFCKEDSIMPSTSGIQFNSPGKKDEKLEKSKKSSTATKLAHVRKHSNSKSEKYSTSKDSKVTRIRIEKNATTVVHDVRKHSKKVDSQDHSSHISKNIKSKKKSTSSDTEVTRVKKNTCERWTNQMNAIFNEVFKKEFKRLTLPVPTIKVEECIEKIRRKCGKEVSVGSVKGKVHNRRKDLRKGKK